MVTALSEGAESIIYPAELFGMASVIKDRISKGYRIRQIDEALRSQRTRKEAKILAMVSEANIDAPRLLLAERFKISMSRLPGKTLNKLLDGARPGDGVFVKIGELAAKMHRIDVVHGDYTPANIMVDKGDVSVIDFGLSEISNSVEDKAIDLLLMKRSIEERRFGLFLKGYGAYERSAEVVKKLNLIERRGRYQTRTLLSK